MNRFQFLFHWSPSERRVSIRENGLRPFSSPVVSTGDVRYPYISLSPSPSAAWSLSGAMEWCSEIEQWDCWQVGIPEEAEVHVRPNFGPIIEEVKIYSPIPPDMVWYVGTREIPAAEAAE